ncbi:MAG: hypothetical protein Q4B65_00175 [Candidatus Saccharibacteria bacterium]|nr:hypothetical protein [Candidatus Saccharibacteria bacterium]
MPRNLKMRKKVFYLLVYDKSGIVKYEVNDPKKDLLFKSDSSNLYLAIDKKTGKTGFLRFPRDRLGNADMQLEVEKLKFLAETSETIESEYKKLIGNPDACVHYDWLFPELTGSVICNESQLNRQVNFLTAKDAELKDFFPLPRLTSRYKVDTRTGAWILGRFYKLQTFADTIRISFKFYPDQVIIEPKMHRMIYLGWNLKDTDEPRQNIMQMARVILSFIKPGDSDEDKEFIQILELMAKEGHKGGHYAHAWLYQIIKKLWGHKYHPFTYLDEETGLWRSLTDAEILNI